MFKKRTKNKIKNNEYEENLECLRQECFNTLLMNIYRQGYEDGKVFPEEGYMHPDWCDSIFSYAMKIAKSDNDLELVSLSNFLRAYKPWNCLENLSYTKERQELKNINQTFKQNLSF